MVQQKSENESVNMYYVKVDVHGCIGLVSILILIPKYSLKYKNSVYNIFDEQNS